LTRPWTWLRYFFQPSLKVADMAKEWIKLTAKATDHRKFCKNRCRMRRIRKFVSEVLTSPMLVMQAITPQAASPYIVNNPSVCNPYFRSVLTITKCQFKFCVFFQSQQKYLILENIQLNMQNCIFDKII
jgi:hypothetical protein